MSKRKLIPTVLVIAPSKSVRGGISSVVKGLLSSDLADKYRFVHIASHVDGNWLEKMGAALAGWMKMCFLLLFFKIDIVHIHGSDIISSSRKYLFFRLVKLFKKKVIYHFHGASFAKQYANSPLIVRMAVKRLFEDADCTICLSKSWGKTIKRIAPRSKVTVVPNGVKLPRSAEVGDITNGPVNLTFLGLIGERKGVFDLVEVVRRLISDGCGIKLFVGGNGEIKKLQKEIVKHNLSQHCSYLGWIGEEQKDQLLSQTDIFVLPSYGEGMPMSILEAMSYGIPIISTTVGGIPEMVLHQKCGILYSPGDIEALTEAIRFLVENTKVREAFGLAARKQIENVFSLKRVSQRMDGIYAKMLAPPKGSPR